MTTADTSTETASLNDSDTLLVVENVTKAYGGVVALRGVDLRIRKATVHGLVGPNGAGKSTVVKIIAGAVSPDSGKVSLEGAALDLSDPRKAARNGVVLVPQELTTVASMTVAENITLGAEPSQAGFTTARGARERSRQALDALGLEIAPGVLAGSLPPWQQRLVMIARAFDRSARLVILDEPTAGLPPLEADLVTDATRRLVDSGVGVIYVSHHFSEIAKICDEVTCIREGRNSGFLNKADISKDRLVELIHDAASREAKTVVPNTDINEVPLLELRNVSTDRLADVSVAFAQGRVTGVVGLLGSGAKEIISLAAGVSQPTMGVIALHGNVIRLQTPSHALKCGITFLAGDRSQSAVRTRSIGDNVGLSALRRWSRFGLVRSRLESDQIKEQLSNLNVLASADKPIGDLSGGNQQRALIGRCLAAQPQVVIFDEPTIGVDVGARADIWKVVRDMAQDRAVVVGSSDPEELVAMCDNVICVKDGKVVDVLAGERLDEHAITSAIS